MNERMMERCQLQIENEEIVRKAGLLQYEEMVKLGAWFYTARGQKADADRIKACRKILKDNAGIFSNFRGNLEYAIVIKMSLAEDPQTWFEQVSSIYKRLVEGRKIPGETLTMAAITIMEQSDGTDTEEIIEKTRKAYSEIRQKHPFLTDDADMSFIVLMALTGMNMEKALDEVERIYQILKEQYRLPSDAAQATALVLSISERPAQQKVDALMKLYEKLKTKKQATSKSRCMSVYAAFADLNTSEEQITEEIAETLLWMKDKKGYGVMGVSGDVRKALAAAFVLQEHEADIQSLSGSNVAAVVSQVVAEEIIFMIIMIIVMSIVINNAIIMSF